MNKQNDKNTKLPSIDHDQLNEVTGGIPPAVPIVIGAAITAGGALWSSGHDKGLADRSCE